MKSLTWKIAAVILAFLIPLTFGIDQSFSSYSNNYYTTQHGSNGTLIFLAVENSMLVHGRIEVTYEGQELGLPVVILPNGTDYKVTSQLDVNFSFSPVLASGSSSTFGGIANISVSPSHPIDVSLIPDVPYGFMKRAINFYKGMGLDTYALFVYNYSSVYVSVVGGF